MKMKATYIIPELNLILFESEEKITDSGNYQGVNFEELI